MKKILFSIFLVVCLVSYGWAFPPVPSKVSNDAYNATTWNGDSVNAPSRDAVRDKIESLSIPSMASPGEIGGTTPGQATFTNLYLESTDINHGVTSILEANQYGAFFKIDSNLGGVDFWGITDGDVPYGALRLTGIVGTADPTDVYPVVSFRAGKQNGTGWQTLGAAETAFVFYNYTTGIGTVYGNGEWILTSLQNTPIGSTISSTGVFSKIGYKSPTELTIADDAITVTQTLHTVDTASDAASDDLVTINGGAAGQVLVIRAAHTDRTVVIKETGNITISHGTTITLDNTERWITFVYDGGTSKWVTDNLADTLSFAEISMGGVILGDSTPDAAGELGYASTQLSVHDGTASRSLLQVASTTITKSEYIPIRYAEDDDSVTAPAAAAEIGTTTLIARSFAEDADNGVVFWWQIPIDYSAGIKFRVYFATDTNGSANETAVFNLSGCAMASSGALACSEGTGQESVLELTTDEDTGELLVSGWSAAITIGGSPAAGQMAKLLLIRDVTGGSTEDDMVGHALISGIEIKYQAKLNASTDY